jgi:hypothetical protein
LTLSELGYRIVFLIQLRTEARVKNYSECFKAGRHTDISVGR